MLLAAFLLAASGNPLERFAGEYSEDKLHIHDQDEQGSFHDVVPTNTSPYFGVHDASPHDEEHGLSSSDSPVSSEDDSRKQDEEPAPSSDTPPDSTGNDGSGNAGDVVSSSASTVNTTSTETSTDGNETNGSNHEDTSSYPTPTNSANASTDGNHTNGSDHGDTFSNQTFSTNATNDSTNTEPSTTYVTQPPDGDPEDCNAADPTNHVYLLCTFLCDGDMMESAKDNATCLLGAATPTPIPAVQEERRVPENAKLGVCSGGTCVERGVEAASPVPVA